MGAALEVAGSVAVTVGAGVWSLAAGLVVGGGFCLMFARGLS